MHRQYIFTVLKYFTNIIYCHTQQYWYISAISLNQHTCSQHNMSYLGCTWVQYVHQHCILATSDAYITSYQSSKWCLRMSYIQKSSQWLYTLCTTVSVFRASLWCWKDKLLVFCHMAEPCTIFSSRSIRMKTMRQWKRSLPWGWGSACFCPSSTSWNTQTLFMCMFCTHMISSKSFLLPVLAAFLLLAAWQFVIYTSNRYINNSLS